MDAGLDKALALISGKSISEYESSQMTDTDRMQINNAIDILFSGLSLKCWLSGSTLADAWTVALDELRNMVFAISVDNVANQYARAITFKHRAKWQNKINLALYGNKKIECSASQRPVWMADAESKIQNGYDILRKKIIGFSSTTLQKSAAQDLTPAFKTMFKEKSANSIEYEREHVHEY